MYEEFIEKCKEAGIHEYCFLKATDVPFEPEVRTLCEANRCGLYGKKWCCPPGVGTFEECKERCLKYKDVFVFSTKSDLEDSFDFEGMTEAGKRHKVVSNAVKKLFEEYISKDILVLSNEGCDNCKECTYPNAPCRFPDKMTPSVESHGIMVNKETAKGRIHYINGANTVTYFSNIFFN